MRTNSHMRPEKGIGKVKPYEFWSIQFSCTFPCSARPLPACVDIRLGKISAWPSKQLHWCKFLYWGTRSRIIVLSTCKMVIICILQWIYHKDLVPHKYCCGQWNICPGCGNICVYHHTGECSLPTSQINQGGVPPTTLFASSSQAPLQTILSAPSSASFLHQ